MWYHKETDVSSDSRRVKPLMLIIFKLHDMQVELELTWEPHNGGYSFLSSPTLTLLLQLPWLAPASLSSLETIRLH